jgi:adenosylcobinamide kinase/adenosylcobinamide-phosphate guanylyltransferase
VAHNLLCPLDGEPLDDAQYAAQVERLERALCETRAKVIVVSNEIGLGVVPLAARSPAATSTNSGAPWRIAALATRA